MHWRKFCRRKRNASWINIFSGKKTIFNHKTRYCKRISNNFISAFSSAKAIALGLEKCSSVKVSRRRKIPFGTKRQKAKGSFKYLQNKFFFSELAEKSKTSDVDTLEWIKLISRLRKTDDRNCRDCEKRRFHWKTGSDSNEIIPQTKKAFKIFSAQLNPPLVRRQQFPALN